MITNSESGINIEGLSYPTAQMNREYWLLRRMPAWFNHPDDYSNNGPFDVATDGNIVVRMTNNHIQVLPFEAGDSSESYTVETVSTSLNIYDVSVRYWDGTWYLAFCGFNSGANTYYIVAAAGSTPTGLFFTGAVGSPYPIKNIAWSQYGAGIFYTEEVYRSPDFIKSYALRFITPNYIGGHTNYTSLDTTFAFPVYGFDCAGKNGKDILLVNQRAPALYTYSSSIDYSPAITTEPQEAIYTYEITYQNGIPFCSDKFEVERIERASSTNKRTGAMVSLIPVSLPAVDHIYLATAIGSDSEVNADGSVTAFSGLYFYFSDDGKHWSQRQMLFYDNIEDWGISSLPDAAKFIIRGDYVYLFHDGYTAKARLCVQFGDIHPSEQINITNYVADYSNSFGESRQSTMTIEDPQHTVFNDILSRDTSWTLIVKLGVFGDALFNWTIEDVDTIDNSIEGAVDQLKITTRNRMALLTDAVKAIDTVQLDTTMMGRDNYSGLLATKDNGGLTHTVGIAGTWESKNYALYLKSKYEESLALSSFKSDIEDGYVSAILSIPTAGWVNSAGVTSNDVYMAGIVFRAVDKNNYWFAVVKPYLRFELGYVKNGTRTVVATVERGPTDYTYPTHAWYCMMQAAALGKPFVLAVEFRGATVKVYPGYLKDEPDPWGQDYTDVLDQGGHRIGYSIWGALEYIIPGYATSDEPLSRGYVGLVGHGNYIENTQSVLPYSHTIDFNANPGNSLGWCIKSGYYDTDAFVNINPADHGVYTTYLIIVHNTLGYNPDWSSIEIHGEGAYAWVDTDTSYTVTGSAVNYVYSAGSAHIPFVDGVCTISNPFKAPYNPYADAVVRVWVQKNGSNVARIDKIVVNSNPGYNPFEDSWSQTFDFAASPHSFVQTSGGGGYIADTGWDDAIIERNFGEYFKVAAIDIELEGTGLPSSISVATNDAINGNPLNDNLQNRVARLIDHTGDRWIYRYQHIVHDDEVLTSGLYLYCSQFRFGKTEYTTANFRKITFHGLGRNIFDANDLLEHDVFALVPNSSATTTFSTSKEKTYTIVVEGAFFANITTPYPGYTGAVHDARWLIRGVADPTIFTGYREILLDGNSGQFGDGAPNNLGIYTMRIKGTGAPFVFTYPVIDTPYASTYETDSPTIRVEVFSEDSEHQTAIYCYQLETHDLNAPLTMETLMRKYGSYAGITKFSFDAQASNYADWTLTNLAGSDYSIALDASSIERNGNTADGEAYCMYNQIMPQTYSFTVQLGLERYSIYLNAESNPKNGSYEITNDADGAIIFFKWINGVSSKLFSVRSEISHPAGELLIAVHQRPGTTATQTITRSIGLWLNDRCLAVISDDGIDVQGRLIGLGMRNEFADGTAYTVYGPTRIPNMNDIIEWSTLSPGEQPMAGIRRAIEDRFVKFWVRFNGALRAIKPVARSSMFTIPGQYILSRQYGEAPREVITHLRFRGPFHWLRVVDTWLSKRYPHRFEQVDNTSMMTLEDCLREARRIFKRIKESVTNAQITMKSMIAHEPEDVFNHQPEGLPGFYEQYVADELEFKASNNSFDTSVNLRKYFDE